MTQALATTDALIVGIAMMDEHEARAYITMMRDDIDMVDQGLKNFRARALDFAEREGWRALGYAGVIPAIQAELGQQYSKSYLSRILKAGSIEQALELPIGQLSERTLRPLGELDTPEQQRQAWERMNELTGGKPTAKAAEQAVHEIKPELDFDDAHRRAAALGYKLSRYGSWWRLDGVLSSRQLIGGRDHPAGLPVDILGTIERFEKAVKEAQKPAGWVCDTCGKTITEMRKPPTGPFICTGCAMSPGFTVPPRPKPTLVELDELLPKELERAGFFWKDADPPMLAHNDGWTCEAPTADAALLMADVKLKSVVRLQKQQEDDEPITVFPALSRAEITAFIREAKDFIEDGGGRCWPTIGKAIRIAARMALEVSE